MTLSNGDGGKEEMFASRSQSTPNAKNQGPCENQGLLYYVLMLRAVEIHCVGSGECGVVLFGVL